jgi:hypothetical protein
MKAWLYGLVLLVGVGLVSFIFFDLLLSPPIAKTGVITELIYVPGKAVAAYTPFQGRKIGDHAIVVAREEQWIAVVRPEDNQMIQVHCTKEHYEQLKVGDPLQFKKYEGQIFHIRYFAHYEDH